MAWKRRRNRLYFYRIVREGRRVRAVYVGAGPEAETLHAEAERRRKELAARQQLFGYLNNRTMDPEQLNLSSSLLTDASFLIAGFWQHANGDWRQKRDRQ